MSRTLGRLPAVPTGDPAGHTRSSPRTRNIRNEGANPYVPDMRKRENTAGVAAAGGGKALYSVSGDVSSVMRVDAEFSPRSGRESPFGGSERAAEYSSTTPRSSAREGDVARRRRLERLHDLYQTSFSRETLLSEQYGKELAAAREQLHELLKSGDASHEKVRLQKEGVVKSRTKVQHKVTTMEEKLNGLEGYNMQLVNAINNLRMQNAPHRGAFKLLQEREQRLAEGMASHKASTHKALDERERFVDQLRHMREDSANEHYNFSAHLRALRHESDVLDGENRASMSMLEAATEQAKRQQYVAMRTARVRKERLEVRYGYLRSQLEGIDRDFRELERIVGVRFVPSQPESLQQIINKFLEKEARVASLQKFWALQNEEIEKLGAEKQRLTSFGEEARRERDELAAEAQSAAEAAEAMRAAAPSQPKRGAEYEEQLLATFDGVCKAVAAVCATAGANLEPALVTKGCSTSTIAGFLSALDQKMDEVEMVTASLKELGVQHAKELRLRKSPEQLAQEEDDEEEPPLRPTALVVDDFLATRITIGPAAWADGETPADEMRKHLPAVSDRDGHDDGDGEAQDTRRSPASRKGQVNRELRDQQIAAWAKRQKEIRGAQTARPSVREYYVSEEARLAKEKYQSFSMNERNPTYPPASLR